MTQREVIQLLTMQPPLRHGLIHQCREVIVVLTFQQMRHLMHNDEQGLSDIAIVVKGSMHQAKIATGTAACGIDDRRTSVARVEAQRQQPQNHQSSGQDLPCRPESQMEYNG